MTKNEEWNEFQGTLLNHALNEHKKTKEYEHLTQRREHILEMIDSDIAPSVKPAMEEMLYELALYAERETELGYKQGMKDCIFILKNLGVLA